MNVKCNCNHCSTHLEFDSQNVGQAITCPKCGMETTLYIPRTSSSPNQQSRTKLRPVSLYAQRLALIRSTTCYRTLRTVIDVTFHLSKAIIALSAILYLIGSFIERPGEPAIGTGLFVLMQVGVVLAALLGIGLLHAAHQAALLLVDIADCNIRLVVSEAARPAEAAVELAS